MYTRPPGNVWRGARCLHRQSNTSAHPRAARRRRSMACRPSGSVVPGCSTPARTRAARVFAGRCRPARRRCSGGPPLAPLAPGDDRRRRADPVDDRGAEIVDRFASRPFLVVVVDEPRHEDRAAAALFAVEHEAAVVEEAVRARPDDRIGARCVSLSGEAMSGRRTCPADSPGSRRVRHVSPPFFVVYQPSHASPVIFSPIVGNGMSTVR